MLFSKSRSFLCFLFLASTLPFHTADGATLTIKNPESLIKSEMTGSVDTYFFLSDDDAYYCSLEPTESVAKKSLNKLEIVGSASVGDYAEVSQHSQWRASYFIAANVISGTFVLDEFNSRFRALSIFNERRQEMINQAAKAFHMCVGDNGPTFCLNMQNEHWLQFADRLVYTTKQSEGKTVNIHCFEKQIYNPSQPLNIGAGQPMFIPYDGSVFFDIN
jgi:hypothetical protein